MNYYDILGIDKNATKKQIKKAYKKMSMMYHPDKNKHGTEMFKEINEAHQVLSDETKRRDYDLKMNDDFVKPAETTPETQTYYTEPEKPIRVNVYEFFKNMDDEFYEKESENSETDEEEESEINYQYYEDLYMEEYNNEYNSD